MINHILTTVSPEERLPRFVGKDVRALMSHVNSNVNLSQNVLLWFCSSRPNCVSLMKSHSFSIMLTVIAEFLDRLMWLVRGIRDRKASTYSVIF